MNGPSTERPDPHRAPIAVNTMRARLTLLGFNLAVITFQLSGLSHRSGGVELPGLASTIHPSPGIALLVGVALSFAAMVAFVTSGELDERGDCTHWSLLLGDVLMYLGMAQTIEGLFAPMLRDLAIAQLHGAAAAAEFGRMHFALAVFGGIAWTAATYVGPIVSLFRSPFDRMATWSIAAVYLVLLVVLAVIWSLAEAAQAALGITDQPPSWLEGLFVPLSW